MNQKKEICFHCLSSTSNSDDINVLVCEQYGHGCYAEIHVDCARELFGEDCDLETVPIHCPEHTSYSCSHCEAEDGLINLIVPNMCYLCTEETYKEYICEKHHNNKEGLCCKCFNGDVESDEKSDVDARDSYDEDFIEDGSIKNGDDEWFPGCDDDVVLDDDEWRMLDDDEWLVGNVEVPKFS